MRDAISVEGITKYFDVDGKRVTAIADLSFSVKRGEYVCILGRSGCGKSTTFNLLLGLLKPDRGRILINGHHPHDDFNKLRGKIGCIFQNDRLLPWRSAIANVLLPSEILGQSDAATQVAARDLLVKFGLRGFELSRPSQLSGGMRQRVAVARALVSNPDILLADEAFGHLDEATADLLRKDFKEAARVGDKTVLHVTHSIDEAIHLADRIIVLGRQGMVLRTFSDLGGSPADRGDIRRDIKASLSLGV